jgi:hypothetical protein
MYITHLDTQRQSQGRRPIAIVYPCIHHGLCGSRVVISICGVPFSRLLHVMHSLLIALSALMAGADGASLRIYSFMTQAMVAIHLFDYFTGVLSSNEFAPSTIRPNDYSNAC